MVKYKLLFTWKNEGYCDFIANESSYNEQKGLKEICESSEKSDSPSFNYFKYRIYTEYLFKERKITLDIFLTEDFDLKELNQNIKLNYCTQINRLQTARRAKVKVNVDLSDPGGTKSGRLPQPVPKREIRFCEKLGVKFRLPVQCRASSKIIQM